MVRKVLFWLHLAAGVSAGLVILIMSATGVALTYERQVNAWTTSHLRSLPPAPGAQALAPEALVAAVASSHPDLRITGLAVSATPDAAVTILAEPAPIYVDAYSGLELGSRRGIAVREFLASTRAWHRWLATEGERRPLARTITGWSNLLFLFIVASGMYLWIPRVVSWAQIRQVLFFRRRLGTSKARDFNWHNVIGIWSAVPLFIIVLGAVPISFPWANDLVYRLVGEEPPARVRPEGRTAGPGGADAPTRGPNRERQAEGGPRATARPDGGAARRGAEAGRPATQPPLTGLDAAFAAARAEQPDWQTISVRFPRRADDALPVAIDRGDGGQPQLRSTLTVARSGGIAARETFADQSTGRQIRSVLRFAHTGEVLGLTGQTVAGLVCAGAVVMVWTGLALSFRRLRSWRTRRTVLLSETPGATVSLERS